MTIVEAISLITRLERYPAPESTYRATIETLIADLMDQTYGSTNPAEKVTLASLEMRARLIRERWLKDGVN